MRATSPPQYRVIGPQPEPVEFPSSEKRMENKWHRLVCELLFNALRRVFGNRILMGWDQFLYFDARNPRRNAAPDVYGRTTEPDRIFDSWKIWELGVPEFVFEVVSDSSWPQDVTEKPELYDHLGIKELIVFDPEPGRRGRASGMEPRALRAWRRLQGALVQVEVEPDRYFMETLNLWLRVIPADQGRLWLRPAIGDELVPTPEEAQKAAESRCEAAESELATVRRELEVLRRGSRE